MSTFLADAISFVAPPPISPVFQDGGFLAGWNEDVTLIAATIAGLWVCDWLLLPRLLSSPKSRWFFLHFLANMVSALAAWPDVYRVLTDPVHAFSGATYTMLANSAVAGIHLYHVLFFKLPPSDIFHHLTFVTILW